MTIGWASSHFGILGVSKQVVTHEELNVAGAIVAICAIAIYAGVKPMDEEERRDRLRTRGFTDNSVNSEVKISFQAYCMSTHVWSDL